MDDGDFEFVSDGDFEFVSDDDFEFVSGEPLHNFTANTVTFNFNASAKPQEFL